MGKLKPAILAVVMAVIFDLASETAAQEATETRICPLPSTSEEILRRRLGITENVELYKFAPLPAWAMRAGHGASLDRWSKDRKAFTAQAKIFFGLAPLTQWLALGRSGSLEEIGDALGAPIVAKAKPLTDRQTGFQYFEYADTPQGRKLVEAKSPPANHAGAQRAVMSLVVASMFVHGRHKEAVELFRLSEYPGERQWHINFLLDIGAVDEAIELHRKPPTSLISMNRRAIGAIAVELLRNKEFDRLVAFLDAELLRIRSKKGDWYWEEPVLQLLSRLGRADWEPPDPLPTSGPASTELGAVASLIAALRSAGREQEAERHRKKVHEHLEKQAAELKERQAKGKPPRIEHMFVAIPSPAAFDFFIEIERAHAFLIKGDLENAEKIVRPVQVDQHARFSRAAVLENLARYARQERLWSKAEELLTMATSEPLLPQHWVPGIWLAGARDAQRAGEFEAATRWSKIAGTALCKLDPDRLERFVSLPVGHPGNLKPFVLPFLDSLYVFMAVREGRLPANAR